MTFQRPAYEQVRIEHNGHVVVLRPSLRAAAILEARHGFPALVRALADLNLTIISDTILTASSPQDGAAFLSAHAGRPLSPFFDAVRQPLTDLISMFTPAPVQQLDPRADKPMPWPEFCRGLYRAATGQLGWTPEAAWNATPTEINEAIIGKFGLGDDKPANNPREEVSEADARSGLDQLRANAKRGRA